MFVCEYISWDEIIHSLYFLNPECVDKDKVMHELECRFDYDSDILGRLYSIKAINIEEYIKYMKLVSEREISRSEYAKNRIKLAKKYGDDYKPFSPYLPCGTVHMTIEEDNYERNSI